MKTLYQTKAISQGGRDGKVKVENNEFALAVPKELGGAGNTGVNPEQLFAAGYAACFESALGLVARNRKLNPEIQSVEAEVGIGPNGTGGFQLSVSILANIKQLDQATADLLVLEAHQVCPYSNAVRGNIDVKVSARVS